MNLSAHFEKGWRLGVGIMLINQENKIFMGERIDNKGAWQMPQGGVNISINEHLTIAAKRELYKRYPPKKQNKNAKANCPNGMPPKAVLT